MKKSIISIISCCYQKHVEHFVWRSRFSSKKNSKEKDSSKISVRTRIKMFDVRGSKCRQGTLGCYAARWFNKNDNMPMLYRVPLEKNKEHNEDIFCTQ